MLRDPKDDYLVALAKAAEVEAIVTGHRDLLDHVGLQLPAITTRLAGEQLALIASDTAAAATPDTAKK